jgi:hypothetical protein
MFSLSKKYAKILPVVIALTVCFCQVKAQIDAQTKDVELPILQETSSNRFGCFVENAVYDKESFKKLVAKEDCASLVKKLKPDFETETLISFQARGDCFIHANAKVFRSDKEKKYKVLVENFSGGCRAAGVFQGLLTVKKMPADYTIEFSEIRKNGF